MVEMLDKQKSQLYDITNLYLYVMPSLFELSYSVMEHYSNIGINITSLENIIMLVHIMEKYYKAKHPKHAYRFCTIISTSNLFLKFRNISLLFRVIWKYSEKNS